MLPSAIEYLNKKEWAYSANKHDDVVTLSLSGVNGIFHCAIKVREDLSILYFISYFGLNCPQDRRADMAQLISHINSNLIYGNFEMDILGGEIKCRTSICYETIDLNYTIIDNLVIKNIYTMDICSVEFSKFINRNSTILEIYSRLYPNTDKLIKEEKVPALLDDNTNT